MAECVNGWFSPELRLLEAEYKNSTLQVHQDTLFCKQSIAELELLCKKEELERKVRANNKLKEHVSNLQEQLECLASELKDSNSQLQGTQNTLNAPAGKTYDRVFEGEEATRNEVLKKCVKVQTKAIQTGVTLAVDALAVVPNICVTEVPVQNLPATDELSLQTSAEQSREIHNDILKKDEVGEGQETGIGASRKRRCINDQEKKASFTASKRRRKHGRENKKSEEHTADGESKLSIKGTSQEKETSILKTASFTTASNKGESDISSRRASKEIEALFLYSKTPAKLQQKSTRDIEDRSKHDSLVDSHNGDTIKELDENIKVRNTSKIYLENLDLVNKENLGQMLEKENGREIKDTRAATESQKLDAKAEQDTTSAFAEKNLEVFVNAEIKTTSTSQRMKSVEIQKLSDAVEALQDDQPNRTAAKAVKKQRNTIRKKVNKKKETENPNLQEDLQGVEENTIEKCKDGNNENRYSGVLRCRTKKQTEVERNTNKYVAQKKVSKKTRQREVATDWNNNKVVIQKTNSATNLQDNTSSPEGELLTHQTSLSASPETDPITNKERPHEGIVTYMSAYRGPRQAETEVPRESEKLVESIQSNPLGAHDSVRESRSSSTNRIKESKENSNRGSFQDSPEGMKSTFRKHHEEMPRGIKEFECSSKNRTAETASDKQNIASSTALNHGDTNNFRPYPREDDSSDNNHASLAKKNVQNAVEFSITDRMKSDEKENKGKAKMARKKRKPTTSERECLGSTSQQSSSDTLSMLDCTKKRKTLFNSRENALMPSMVQSVSQVSFINTTLSKSRSNAGIPPCLSAFMRSFIAPKLKKTG